MAKTKKQVEKLISIVMNLDTLTYPPTKKDVESLIKANPNCQIVLMGKTPKKIMYDLSDLIDLQEREKRLVVHAHGSDDMDEALERLSSLEQKIEQKNIILVQGKNAPVCEYAAHCSLVSLVDKANPHTHNKNLIDDKLSIDQQVNLLSDNELADIKAKVGMIMKGRIDQHYTPAVTRDSDQYGIPLYMMADFASRMKSFTETLLEVQRKGSGISAQEKKILKDLETRFGNIEDDARNAANETEGWTSPSKKTFDEVQKQFKDIEKYLKSLDRGKMSAVFGVYVAKFVEALGASIALGAAYVAERAYSAKEAIRQKFNKTVAREKSFEIKMGEREALADTVEKCQIGVNDAETKLNELVTKQKKGGAAEANSSGMSTASHEIGSSMHGDQTTAAKAVDIATENLSRAKTDLRGAQEAPKECNATFTPKDKLDLAKTNRDDKYKAIDDAKASVKAGRIVSKNMVKHYDDHVSQIIKPTKVAQHKPAAQKDGGVGGRS
jgi:hypothetical protein